jgi:intein/homing endonuclease
MATHSEMKFEINGPNQPFDSLGLFTFLRTYSRKLKEEDPNSSIENWSQTLTRCINACNSQLKCGFSQEEGQEFFDLLYNLKCSFAGRFLWQLGTRTVDKLGLMSLQNCAFCVIDNYKSFTWLMNFLMLGAGVGYRITEEDMKHFPPIKHATIIRQDNKDADFILGDHRGAWIQLLSKVLKAHFYSGTGFTYSTQLLREKGVPIKSFGGVSSGGQVLCDGMTKINDILNRRASSANPALTTVDALDIANIIGMIVVSGNVRRCLPKGSLVHIREGLMAIEKLKVGDEVLTTQGYRKVTNVFDQGVQPVVKIVTTCGSFRCTSNHRMATRTFSNSQIVWKMACDIDFSNYLLSLVDRYKPCITDLEMERVIDIKEDGEAETWDIEVEEMHEFFCNTYLTHNSAQIALGDVSDKEYLNAKRWDLGSIPNWRCYSNNSIICNNINDILEDNQFWSGYEGNGEPYGLINLDLAKKCGRIGETQYPDADVKGVNPCVSGDTLVLTDKGEIPVIDLVGKGQITVILNGKKYPTTAEGFFETGTNRLLFKLTTNTGKTVRATPEHKFLINSKGWTELKNVQICDMIAVNFDDAHKSELYEEVVSIQKDANENVYDCTVPEVHMFSANGILAHNCSEQNLADHETCCLGEIFLPNITSFEELKKASTFIYRACKHSLTLPCADSQETEDIVHKHMRIGIGMTGVLQATEEQRSWLSPCYEYLREFDKTYSDKHNLPPSIKLTTVKPSGCSRGDSLILTNKGLQRLDELGDVKGNTWQEVKDTQAYTDKDGTEVIAKFYVNGKVETRKIETEDGVELESSLNHRYRILDQSNNYVWKRVDELKLGDRLVVKLGGHPDGNIQTQLSGTPNLLTPRLAKLLGQFYGNGSVEGEDVIFNYSTIKFSDIINTMTKDFNIQTMSLLGKKLIIHSQELVSWLTANVDVEKNKVPKFIRYASATNVTQFLDGFFQRVFPSVDNSINQEILQLCRSCGLQKRILRADNLRVLDDKTNAHYINGFLLDPIISIVKSNCETYDIEVENAHHYRLNGFVSHNTLSLLGHVSPGIHPAYSHYLIRRIRVSSESKLIKLAKEHGYHVEYVQNFDGTLDYGTSVISFPYKYPEGTVVAKDLTAIDQLEWVKFVQKNWSDNAVSVTVYYKKEELPGIKAWLKENYNDNIKSVSFLLHSGHGFIQAPLEEITKEKYEEMLKTCRPIDDVGEICHTTSDEKYATEGECIGGVCPMK